MSDNETATPFASAVETIGSEMAGEWLGPRQMLAEQTYDAHASIHDDATAQKLGFKGGTIEGPTHFSQLARLGVALWGERFLSHGCLSAHYRNPVFEGEKVRAFIEDAGASASIAKIRMEKEDGVEVLRGTASIAPDADTALDQRLRELPPLQEAVILRDVQVGMKTPRRPVVMAADQHMGALYPFSLRDKLRVITEPSPWYEEASPFGAAIIPFEMISVLMQYTARENGFPIKGPAVGLFADQEIRLLDGPVFVGAEYEIEREVVALSGSRRTESVWVKTSLYRPGETRPVATMLLNHATLKDSYAPYEAELAAIRGA